MLFWLGGLRSSEVFNGTWLDFRVYEPHCGPGIDLPADCGAFFYPLGPETKMDWVSQMEVLMAYKTLSGYFLGNWYHRALSFRFLGADSDNIFTQADGTAWTSHFFRKHFLYPSLQGQQAVGDPSLRPFRDQIPSKFW
eukprot:CAMPEP_0178895498 /NCGR_PEP_ID=MMETSP0786-20121207/627_1 /TAXON_ID=186022 /ORGANISM="Thalassionema frauenfeldii, Strain CCMP 1798" /LENGTH=137 /DNA_ID=CAMNT_0020565749 /DNA_START=429 /DNA_END=839 /DNA_ORIENTATION=-